MIHEQDLKDAIAECQGQRNPDANTCIKLAAYITILNSLYPEKQPPEPGYFQLSSGTGAAENIIDLDSETEFSKAVQGRDAKEIMPVMDELMETLRLVYPRLYNGVMNKL